MDGDESEVLIATSGVPQGSILGPLFFNIFIDDISSVFKNSTPYIFADDLKLLRIIRNNDDTKLLQADLESLSEWCKLNKMHLNHSKCFHIKFTRKRQKIPSTYKIQGTNVTEVEVIRDLGVLLDSKLQFTQHYDAMVTTAYKSLGFVLRNSKLFKNSHTTTLLYNCFVRNQLDYCSPLWNPIYKVHEKRIERVQKKLLGYLAFREHIHKSMNSYNERLDHFNLLSLKNRRVLSDLTFLHKLLNNSIDCPELLSKVCINVPSRVPRYPCPSLLAPYHRTNVGKQSPIVRLTQEYNMVAKQINELDIFVDPLAKFRRLITDAIKKNAIQL